VFCPLLSSSEHSGVPEDSQPPTFPSVGLHPHTWPKWGCDTNLEWCLKVDHKRVARSTSWNRMDVITLTLGSWLKQGVWKGEGWECNLGITFTLPRVRKNVKKWTHTFPNGLLESRGISEFSKNNLKGQNSLDWRVLYTIGKFLKCRCLKLGHMIHLSTYNISYGRKKGQESKCQFDSQPLKVNNRPNLCACKGHATCFWKNLSMKAKNLLQTSSQSEV